MMKIKYLIYIIFISILFSSCTHIKYITETKIEYRDKIKIDSIYIEGKDSIIEKHFNDTIFIEKWRKDYISKYIIEKDTIAVIDSIPYPVEVTTVVTKNSKFATFSIWWFVISLILLVLYIVLKIIFKIYFKKLIWI